MSNKKKDEDLENDLKSDFKEAFDSDSDTNETKESKASKKDEEKEDLAPKQKKAEVYKEVDYSKDKNLNQTSSANPTGLRSEEDKKSLAAHNKAAKKS